MKSQESYMTDALGPLGAKPFIDIAGKRWTLTIDCPFIISEMEQLCLAWARGVMQSDLNDLPLRQDPKTFDFHDAQRILSEFRQRKANGDFRPGKSGYDEYMKTRDGKLSILLAALKTEHPDVTLTDCMGILVTAPEAALDAMESVGKAMRTMIENVEKMPAAHRPATH